MVPSAELKPKKKRARAKVLILLFLASTGFVLVRGRCILPEAQMVSFSEPLRLERVLEDSQSAVVAHIVDIARPIRNHTCFLHTVAGDEHHHSNSHLYTAIRVEIEDRLFFESPAVEFKAPEVMQGAMTIWVVGDPRVGSGWDRRFGEEPITSSTFPLREGQRRLFFLAYANLHYVDRIGPLKWMSAPGGFTWAPWSDDRWFPSMRSLQQDLASPTFPRLHRITVDQSTRAVPREDLRSVLQALHGRASAP